MNPELQTWRTVLAVHGRRLSALQREGLRAAEATARAQAGREAAQAAWTQRQEAAQAQARHQREQTAVGACLSPQRLGEWTQAREHLQGLSAQARSRLEEANTQEAQAQAEQAACRAREARARERIERLQEHCQTLQQQDEDDREEREHDELDDLAPLRQALTSDAETTA